MVISTIFIAFFIAVSILAEANVFYQFIRTEKRSDDGKRILQRKGGGGDLRTQRAKSPGRLSRGRSGLRLPAGEARQDTNQFEKIRKIFEGQKMREREEDQQMKIFNYLDTLTIEDYIN